MGISFPLLKMITALGLAALPITISHAADPTSYPIICKGGGNMRLSTGSTANFSVITRIDFYKSTRPATSGLRPGECAWMDRGMESKEPPILFIETHGVLLGVEDKLNNGKEEILISISADRSKSAKLNYIIQAVRQGREFQVYAYNNKQGKFVVTKMGP